MGKPWSKREEDVLRQLWEKEEVSFEDILKVFFERTEKAIEGKVKELGLTPQGQRVKAKLDEDYLRKLLTVKDG